MIIYDIKYIVHTIMNSISKEVSDYGERLDSDLARDTEDGGKQDRTAGENIQLLKVGSDSSMHYTWHRRGRPGTADKNAASAGTAAGRLILTGKQNMIKIQKMTMVVLPEYVNYLTAEA